MPTAVTYWLRVFVTREAEGGFSVVAADLPGCASQGDTFEGALQNIAEAAKGCIEEYIASTTPIPWVPCEQRKQRPLFAEECRVDVEVMP